MLPLRLPAPHQRRLDPGRHLRRHRRLRHRPGLRATRRPGAVPAALHLRPDRQPHLDHPRRRHQHLLLPGHSLIWDTDGSLASVAGTSYIYDADGTQLIRHDPGSATLFLPNGELKLDTATKTLRSEERRVGKEG